MTAFSLRIEIPRDRRYRTLKLGKEVKFGRRVELQFPSRISIGNRVTINNDCYLAGDGGIEIQDLVLIGPGTYILSTSHSLEGQGPIQDNPKTFDRVLIKSGSWIGANCVLMPGVTIGENAVVGANSTVTKDVGDYEVVAGSPAKHIRSR